VSDLRVYFSDFFNVDEDIIESYGAVNISLINDLPLFIDPFLLFNSNKEEYQLIHNAIIDYLQFLKARAKKYPDAPNTVLRAWFSFSEVRQTWLGFSLSGNSGRGLGKKIAHDLHRGLLTIFKNFGSEKVPKSPHIEKLCLISNLVGRDKCSFKSSDFCIFSSAFNSVAICFILSLWVVIFLSITFLVAMMCFLSGFRLKTCCKYICTDLLNLRA